MLHPAHRQQIDRLIRNMKANRLDMDEQEYRIPVDRYFCPDRFRREIDLLYRRYPVIVGRHDQLAKPGSCMTHDALGVPLLLVRDKAGDLRAFLNVCRHRNTRLVSDEGICRKSTFVCPYHNWMYGLDGGLLDIPRRAEGFPNLDPADHGLVRVPLAVRHGFIWVVADPGGTLDLDAHLDEIDGDLEALSMGDHLFFRQASTPVKANWKMILDAFSEAYHVQRLHKASLASFFEDLDAVFDVVGRHMRAAIARAGIRDIEALPEDQWRVREHVTFTYHLFPNSLLVVSPDYINHLGFFPQSPDETIVVNTMLVDKPPRGSEEEAHWQRSFDLIHGEVFSGEDFFISEQAQSGIRSGANTHLTAGRFEQGVRIYHGIIEAALAEGAPVQSP